MSDRVLVVGVIRLVQTIDYRGSRNVYVCESKVEFPTSPISQHKLTFVQKVRVGARKGESTLLQVPTSSRFINKSQYIARLLSSKDEGWGSPNRRGPKTSNSSH